MGKALKLETLIELARREGVDIERDAKTIESATERIAVRVAKKLKVKASSVFFDGSTFMSEIVPMYPMQDCPPTLASYDGDWK